MPSWETLLAFAAATMVFAWFPGPALLYTAAQTLSRGRRAGFLAAFGIHVGCYLHVAATALGLTAVLRHVPEAYVALKLVGAGYLIWIGIGMIRSKAGGEVPAVEPKSARRAFIDSMIVEILNPKVALFFVAFLPQFVDPAAAFPVWLQFLVLGTFVNATFSSVDVVTVLTASAVMKRLSRSNRAARVVRVAGGSILVGLGLKLATDRT